MTAASSEDSDQPGRPPSLIRVLAVRLKKHWVLSYPLSAQRRLWSDWADAHHFVGFVMRRLKSFKLFLCCHNCDFQCSLFPIVLPCGQWRLWSDLADAQADLSLHWEHMPFCWLFHAAAEINSSISPKTQGFHCILNLHGVTCSLFPYCFVPMYSSIWRASSMLGVQGIFCGG